MSNDLEACVSFLQQLIRTPALSGQEGEIARLVATTMEALGYEEVSIDEVGNVIGLVRGRGSAPAVIFNTHLDNVDVGDPAAWPRPPYGGEVHDGTVFGRGAVDIKGPLAAQVFGVGRLVAAGGPPGDVYVTAVVQEEIGGVGARAMAARWTGERQPPPVIVGEPSSNTVRRGHRGRTEIAAVFRGRSVHASVPQNGVNPLISAGRFLAGLPTIEHRIDPELGPSSVTPTLISTDQTSANVVPSEVRLTCDWRNVPGESAADALAVLQELADRSVDEGASVEVTVPVVERRTYTGETASIPADNPAYLLAADDPLVVAVEGVVRDCFGDCPPAGVWKFATDGGHFAAAGLSPVGFGPGNEFLAHTIDERIEVEAIERALEVNERLAAELGSRLATD